jgi:peptidoglycan hydrolase-like protein with peptidoglycan-binding domain
MSQYEDVIFGAVYTDAKSVKKVQAALNINVDGKIGPQTREAVKQFNINRGAPEDGENITDGTLYAVDGMSTAKSWWDKLVGPSKPEAKPEIPPYYGTPAPKAPAPSYSSILAPSAPAAPPAPIVLTSPAPGAAPADGENFLTRKVKGLNVPAWWVIAGGVGALAIGFGVYATAQQAGRRVR